MQRSLTKSIVTLFAVAIVTLVALLFAVFLPADSTPAYAAEPVEGTTTTEQVSNASGVMDADALKAAVENGGEVVLGSDITADVVVPKDVAVTLDLNGHTLTNSSNHTIINYGTLTITDGSADKNGTVDNVTHGKAAIYNEVGATFTLASGTLDRTKEAGTSSSSSGDNSYYTLLNHGTAYINGGTIQQGGLAVGKYSSLVENGWYDGSKNTEKKPSIMTVNGGTFLGGLNSIKNDDYGVLTIKDATVKNVAQAALLNWNVATIEGGSFSTDGGSAVILNGYINDTMDKGELTITGGTFTTNGGDFPLIARMDGSEPTGGVITVTSTDADLVAAAINVPGVTTYVKEGDAVTEMSVSDLAGLKEALNTETVKKITLACDITSDESLFFERDVTLDMNGYELTVAKATTHPVVIDKANVTIVNGNITVGEGVYANLNAILVTNGATLTLGTKSDETVVEDDGVFVTTNSGYGIVVSGGAALNMYGGSVTAKWCALGTNNTTGTAAFKVYGATLESTDDSAIFMSCYTDVYLKDTAVIGKTAIDIRIGNLTVDGGSITSTYDGYHEMTYDEVTASGTLTGGDGSAILVKANYYYDKANNSNEVSIKISETTEIKGAVTIYDLDGVGNMLPNDKVVDQTEALQTFVDSLKNSHASVETHFYDVALPAGGSEDGTIVNVDKVFVADNESVTATVSSLDELRAAFAEKKIGKIVIGADFEISGNRIEIGDIDNSDAATRSITLDLNGHTLKIGTIRVSDTDSSANTAALYLGYNVSLTLTNTVGTGTIDASGANDLTVPIGAMRDGSTLIVERGTIIVDTDRESCVFARGGGKIVITGGTFINNCTSEYAYGGGRPLTVNIENNSTSTIDITGGTFKGRNPMSGDDNTDVAFVSKDSKVVEYKSGDMKVVDQNSEVTGDDVVAVYTYADNETGDTVATVYTEDALRAALADEDISVVRLGADIEIGASEIEINRTVTLDLGANKLSRFPNGSTYYISVKASNVKITADKRNDDTPHISSLNGIYIADGISNVSINNLSVLASGIAVNIEGATSVTINGATIKSYKVGVLASNDSGVNIVDSSVSATVYNQYLANEVNAIEIVSGADVTISGKSIIKAFGNNGVKGSSGAGIFISGKSEGVNDTRLILMDNTEVTADAYGIVGNGTHHGTYIEIKDNAVVKVTNFAIYHPQVGELNISGNAQITGASGIEMRAGTLIVTGTPTVTATDETYDESPLNDGPRFAGVALGVSRYFEDSDRGVTLDISGGTFVAQDKGYAFYEKDIAVAGAEDNTSLSFAGATFNGDLYSENETGFIKSGTFSEVVDKGYIAEGSDLYVTEAGTLEVAPEGSAPAVSSKVVATIGSKGYGSVSDAVSNAKENDTIKLYGDVTENVTINKSVTLDLNGYTLENKNTTSGNYLLIEGGNSEAENIKVTIRNGNISSGDAAVIVMGYVDVVMENVSVKTDGRYGLELYGECDQSVTAEGCTFEGDTSGVAVFGAEKTGMTAAFSATDCTIKGGDYGVSGNGTYHLTTIDIVDSKVSSDRGTAIYHPQVGTLTISGGSEISGISGIEMRAGTLKISGNVSVVATAEEFSVSDLGDGPRFAGVALGVSRYFEGSDRGVTLDISGGTFVAQDKGYAFYEKDIAVAGAEDNTSLSLAGATFNGDLYSENETGFIKSGTFSKGVDLAYVADGQKVGVKPGGGMEVGSEISGEGYDVIYTVSGDENASMSAIVYTADMFKKALDNDSVTEITLGKDFGGSYTIDRDVTIKAADGVTFSGNIVIESSSVTRTTGPNVTLEGVAFKGNGSGTAISVKNGSLTMTGGSITNYDNGIVAGTRGGAAVDISVDNVEFTELDEKGIYGEAFGDLTVKNSTFNGAGNDASGAGNPYTGRLAAAIDINQTVAGGSVSITGNTFVDCGDNGSTSGAIKIKVRNIPVEQSYGQAGDFAAEHNELVGSFEAVSVTNNTFTNCSRDIVVGTGYVADTYVEVVLGEGENANTSYVSSEDDATTRDLIFVDNAHVDDAESLMNAFADEDLVLIEVFANITTTDIIVVDKPGKSVVLDLNGYTITANDTTTSTENGVSIGAGFLYLADGTLTVKDGTVNAIEDSFRVQTEATDDYAKLILADDLTVTSQNANAVYIRALNQQESTTPNAVLETAADLKVSGKYAAIQGNGMSTDGPVSVTVTGGDIVADPADETIDGTGLYLPGRGEYLITGGTITAPTGVEFRAGTLTITGGTITATGEFAADPNGNGATTSGVAVAMMQHTTERDLTLNITGGEFNGAYAVYQQNIQNNDSGTLTMSLTGGTFNGNVDSENCTEYISGGQYSVKPAAEAFKPGFDGVEYDGYYVVIETTTDDIAALLAARIDAQADVRTYAAVLGIDWKAMEALADTDDVAAAALDAYNAIGNATSEGYVAIARSAAMDALDAYAAAMAESDALASAITDAQKEVREYAAARGYAWADIADTAVLDAYNAIASVQAVDGVDDAKADAISAVREYLDGLESSGAESELEAAKLKAQTSVKMYIASADIGGWTNLLLINENGERVEKDAVAPIFAMYDMIEESTTVADIDAYMWKAISQVDTYVNALENWRKAAADEVTAAAQETSENANDAVVVPTSVYAAINGAVNYTEVNAYKTNALAEIADIRAYRADIAEQGSELDLIYGTLTEFKNAFDALDASLTGENNAFDTLLKDVQDAITTAQNAITGGTDESSESLASIKSYLENTIYKAMTDFKADVDTAFGDLGSDLAAYGDVLIALRDALVGDGTDGSVGKIDEILADIADAQSDITNIKTTVGSLATTEDLTTAVTDIKGALTVSEGKITNAITAAQNAITSAIASVRTDIDALETALAGYESDFEGLSGTLAQINSSLGGKIDAAQADIDAIKTAIDALGTPASAAAVTELATAIDELKAAVDEISVSVSAPSAVETVKTEATADIAEWLNAYVDEIVNSVTASNGKAYAAAVTFAPALETTDGDLYAKLLKAFDKDNADLVLKYYNDALTAIDAATTADEVNTAVATFKAQVASVEAASGNTSDLTVVYVLLIVVLVVLVVAVVVAAVLSRKRRVPVGYAPAPTPAPAPATSETTEQTEKAAPAEKPEVTDDTAATAVEPDEAPDEDAGERVVINASVKTFDEAYDEMSDTLKDMFEKVREYALSKNGATGVRIGNGVRVKRGSKQIVKLTVRRGYPVAMFVLENEMLKDYRRTAGSSAKLKVPATELVLREPSDLDAAYMMVDLAVRQLDADVEAAKERRRELLRERRRQRREAMEAAKAAQAAQAEATTEQAEPAATEQNEAATPEQAVDEDKTE